MPKRRSYRSSNKIAKAVRIYALSDLEANEPFTLAAVLLLDGGDEIIHVHELGKACYPLFSLEEWPDHEQTAYHDSRTDAERAEVVVRRMDAWAAEIEGGGSSIAS